MATHLSRSARFLLASLAVLIGGGAAVFAQEDIDLRLFRPQIDVSGETFQDKPFDDQPGEEYGSDALSFAANIPLGKLHVRWDKEAAALATIAESPQVYWETRKHLPWT